MVKKVRPPKEGLLKLDLGCGDKVWEDFIGVDILDFPCVSYNFDITKKWPIDDGVVDEYRASHLVEHLDNPERTHFVNELYRTMKIDAKATIICPHWSSCRAYGDPTHKWPPLGEFWFYYLSREWRLEHAPATDKKHLPWGFDCDFEATWGYGLNPSITTRSAEFQQFAVSYYREAAIDIHGSLIKRK